MNVLLSIFLSLIIFSCASERIHSSKVSTGQIGPLVQIPIFNKILSDEYPEFNHQKPKNNYMLASYEKNAKTTDWNARIWYLKINKNKLFNLDFSKWDNTTEFRNRDIVIKGLKCHNINGAHIFCSCRHQGSAIVFNWKYSDNREDWINNGLIYYKKENSKWELTRILGYVNLSDNLRFINSVVNVVGNESFSDGEYIESYSTACESTAFFDGLPNSENITKKVVNRSLLFFDR